MAEVLMSCRARPACILTAKSHFTPGEDQLLMIFILNGCTLGFDPPASVDAIGGRPSANTVVSLDIARLAYQYHERIIGKSIGRFTLTPSVIYDNLAVSNSIGSPT